MRFYIKILIFFCLLVHFGEPVVKRQIRFGCHSTREIIDYSRLCNGIADCSDASDETESLCESTVCPADLKKCDYGACVGELSTCRTGQRSPAQPQPINGACKVTSLPKNGRALLQGEIPRQLQLNDIVMNYETIEFKCDRNAHLTGGAASFCEDGAWSVNVPECQTKCRMSDVSSITYVTHCSSSGAIQRCGTNDLVDPGTSVSITCQRGYQPQTANEQHTVCQDDGTWSRSLSPCVQICGEEGPEGTPYIIGGRVTNNTKVPWHVGIYRTIKTGDEPSFICGGTILSSKVVISAMHCFWDDIGDTASPVDEFRVIAGKFYRSFSDSRERSNYQVKNIAEIHHPPGYNDREGLYANDLAVLVLSSHIEFKVHIAPVCIDYNLEYEERVLKAGLFGRVSGWGLESSHGLPSDELKAIQVPVIDRSECRQSFTRSFRPFLTGDKFCAGEKDQGVGLCQGDSGGGLVFPNDPRSDKPVYFLRGIVSAGPNKAGSCGTDQYTLFTNTAHFADFVKTIDFKHRPEYVDIVPIVKKARPTVAIGKVIPVVPDVPRNVPIMEKPRPSEVTDFIPVVPDIREATSTCLIDFNAESTIILNSVNETLSQGDHAKGKIRFVCENSSDEPNLSESECIDGQWQPKVDEPLCPAPFPTLKQVRLSLCQPVSDGKPTFDCRELLTDSYVPWRVAVYAGENYRCSGPLAYDDGVLIRPSCVENYSTDELRVVAGKLKPSASDLCPQIFRVRKVEIAPTDFLLPLGALSVNGSLVAYRDAKKNCEY